LVGTLSGRRSTERSLRALAVLPLRDQDRSARPAAPPAAGETADSG